MDYIGNWKNNKTGEEIKISKSTYSDDFSLKWAKKTNNFSKEEIIQISIGDASNSHIDSSVRFGNCKILNIDSNTIEIKGERFIRKKI